VPVTQLIEVTFPRILAKGIFQPLPGMALDQLAQGSVDYRALRA
jgi:hypothetical protein